jgi:hypothetical protein
MSVTNVVVVVGFTAKRSQKAIVLLENAMVRGNSLPHAMCYSYTAP